MATNELLPFAAAGGANVITQAEYAALAARLSGFTAGLANPRQMNKAWRQAAFAAAMIGEFTADYSGDDVVDDGDVDKFEASFLKALRAQFPRFLTGDVTLWVRTDGNDSTGDGSANTSDKAFLTPAAAIAYAAKRFYFAGFKLIIRLGNTGTYPAPTSIGGVPAVDIIGNTSSQGSYTLQGLSGPLVNVLAGTVCRLSGLTLTTTTATSWCAISGAGELRLEYVTFAQTGSGGTLSAVMSAANGGTVYIGPGCIANTISGTTLMGVSAGGTMYLTSTFTILGTCNFTVATVNASLSGANWILATGTAFNTAGGAVNSARYLSSLNAVISVNGGGANVIPGTVAGSTSSGGQYV